MYIYNILQIENIFYNKMFLYFCYNDNKSIKYCGMLINKHGTMLLHISV